MKLTLVFVLIFCIQSDCLSRCPTPLKLWGELSKCHNLRNNRRAASYVRGYVYDTTCSGEKVVEACLRRIQSVCTNGAGNAVTRYLFSKLVDVDVITRANQYFCDNANLLQSSGPCLRRITQSADMRNCTRNVGQAYDREFSSSSISLTPRTIREVNMLTPAMCRFSDGMIRCFETNMEGLCNSRALAVLLNLAFASTPPACM